MNNLLLIIFSILTISSFGQADPNEEVLPIVNEGKLLYKAEMASWYGTDLFLETYKDTENIGGYFSYQDNDSTKCIFYSKSNTPKVIGTISFDSTYDVKTAKIDLSERDLTQMENDLYEIRNVALDELNKNSDGLFKFYQNTNPNLIPLITENEKKLYILTGPNQNGFVIIGNDYLLTFDENNKIVAKKELHKNIIPIEYGDGKEKIVTMHSHLPETGDFITATDICTLMLYEKLANWTAHTVVSKKYLNNWNCETDELEVIPMETIEKIIKEPEEDK